MAQEDEKKPTAAEKGKAKATDAKTAEAKPDGDDTKGATTGGMCAHCDGHCGVSGPDTRLTAGHRGAQRRRPATQE